MSLMRYTVPGSGGDDVAFDDMLGRRVRSGGWHAWAEILGPRFPRELRERARLITNSEPGKWHVFWYDLDGNPLNTFTIILSDDFPTELDIAQLCLECP